MTSPRLNLIVLHSLDPSQTLDFYNFLGIGFEKQQHENGPVHWSADLEGLVLEVYPVEVPGEVGHSIRLGFEVEDLTCVVHSLRVSGVEILREIKASNWGLRAVVRDPDNRSIELLQR